MDENVGVGARLRAGVARVLAGLGSLFQGAERWTARGTRAMVVMALVAVVAVVALVGVAHEGFEHLAGFAGHERHQVRQGWTGWQGHEGRGPREGRDAGERRGGGQAGAPAGQADPSTSGGPGRRGDAPPPQPSAPR